MIESIRNRLTKIFYISWATLLSRLSFMDAAACHHAWVKHSELSQASQIAVNPSMGTVCTKVFSISWATLRSRLSFMDAAACHPHPVALSRCTEACRKENTFALRPRVKMKWCAAIMIAIFPAISFASGTSGSQLMVIEKLVSNVSQELVALKGQNQQNWNKFFEQQISKQFTSSDYPVWHDMQSKMGEVRNTLGQTSLAGSAQGDLYNSNLVNQASSVDTSSVKLASRVIQQIDNDSDSNLASAVNIPLSSRWHQGLADANTIQVLKALSAQVAVSNAIQYKELQQSRNQQLLQARVLVELTQLNQNIVKLQGK